MPLILLLLLLTACSAAPTEFAGTSHDIGYRLLIGERVPHKQEIKALLSSTFEMVDTHLNNWNPRSEISHLNRLAAEESVTLSPPLSRLLHHVDRLITLTDGRFDPTVEPLQQAWKAALRQGKLPDTFDAPVGWKHIHLEGDTFTKDEGAVQIDLGGISKGFTVDLLAEELFSRGFTHFYVEWGGEIRTHGHHPQRRPWRIAVRDTTTLELHDQAIATSGDTFQAWEVEGTTYLHILNPQTKRPLTRGAIRSATVVASSCTDADALATSLMLFTAPEEVASWAAAHPEYQVWLRVEDRPDR